jgi:hypothetical protein
MMFPCTGAVAEAAVVEGGVAGAGIGVGVWTLYKAWRMSQADPSWK